MTDNSPLERAQRELGEGRPAWAQSPLLLLAGLILVAGVVAVLVPTLGGGDEAADEPAAVATTASADDTTSAEAPAAPTGFGGTGIPEVAAVEVVGANLPAYTGEGADPARRAGWRAAETFARAGRAHRAPVTMRKQQ